MRALLLDTNIVSILFNRNHSLRDLCLGVATGNYLVVSFITRAELLLWPAANHWGQARRAKLDCHLELYTTVYPDSRTCEIWVEVTECRRRAGRPIQTADAWIAATALQWGVPLVTTNFKDFAAIDGLEVIPIGTGSSSTDPLGLQPPVTAERVVPRTDGAAPGGSRAFTAG